MGGLLLQVDEGWHIGQSIQVAESFDDDLFQGEFSYRVDLVAIYVEIG